MSCFLPSYSINNPKTYDDECLEFENLKVNNLDKYIRIKLGQKIFPRPSMKDCLFRDENHYCKICKNCKYNQWYFTWKKEGHLRFDFDARNFTKNNLKIVQLFGEYFEDIKVVIHSYKNFIEGYFITHDDYIKYDYWGQSYNNIKFPCIATIELSGLGTVEIIKTMIERIKKINYGCQIPGNCGFKCYTLCDNCIIYENKITPSIFNFKIKKISYFESIFPKTTKKINMNDYNQDIIIDCENNFTDHEKSVIYSYNIITIKDLMIHIRINNLEKITCLKYYKFITENYKLNGFGGIFNKTVSVQFNNYIINIIILHDGAIKYCSSSGEKNTIVNNI